MRNAVLLLFQLVTGVVAAQQTWNLRSPDQRIRVEISLNRYLAYSVIVDNKQILDSSPIDMFLTDGRSLSRNARLKKIRFSEVRDLINPPVAEKRKTIPDYYNSCRLELKNGFAAEFRVYDDGLTYRILSHFTDSIIVLNELAKYQFHQNAQVYFTEVVPRENADSFHTSFEEPYTIRQLDSISSSSLIFSPLLLKAETGPGIVLTESDLEDYPGMFFRGNENRELYGRFAGFPLNQEVTAGEFPAVVVRKRAEYIAKTKGNRSFPWRIMMIAREDRELPANDLVYRLGAPSRIADPTWIRPGKGTDEWIIGINLFNVPFKAGLNTATYKYYIDFAARFGFQRIMMDAGWSDYKDLFSIHPDIDMDSIAAYAREKGIGLSLWTLAHTLDRQLEAALDQFKKWGVDFIMTDFMDRDDQLMVNFYHRVAEACARRQIMVMYHGAFKPAGFSRTWPNAITREAVLGSEYNIWSQKANPDHDLLLPFIRMTAGPMDYEPGLLDNATAGTFRPIGEKVMSQGTRCHQAAMFVVYDSPVQLFSGNPSQAWLEPEFSELIGSIPTTWDTTIVLQASLGEFIVTARRKGNEWFIGAMTNWTARDLAITLNFLPAGQYHVLHCQDGVNADRYASDYFIKRTGVEAGDNFELKMAPGGGSLLRLIPVH